MLTLRNQKLNIVFSVTLGLLGWALIPAAAVSAAPSTFVVNSTADADDANTADGICETATPGQCTLRAAISQANTNSNAADTDVVDFSGLGAGVQTITPSSIYPTVSQRILIDGYTKSDAVENTSVSPLPLNGTITIQIDGVGSSNGNAFQFGTGSDNSIIRGLAVYNFIDSPVSGSCQISIGAANVGVFGNYVGVLADGTTSDTSSVGGVCAESGSSSAAKIGGANPQDRNILSSSGSSGAGLSLSGTGHVVYGNYIGMSKDGVNDFNGQGCLGASEPGVNAAHVIGGTATGQRNLISGCDTYLFVLVSNNNVVQGNYIGTDYTGKPNSGITNGVGVSVAFGATGNLIGGTSLGEGNIISGVSGAGIAFTRTVVTPFAISLASTKNAALGNSIYKSSVFSYVGFGNSNQGIDILESVDTTGDFSPETFNFTGPTANDAGDVDTGPNDFMNFPVLNNAVQNSTSLKINFDLDIADSPVDQYRVEFFASDEATIFDYGPGQSFLGAVTVASGTGRSADLTLFPGTDLKGKVFSATATPVDATMASGFGSTSEFAQNIQVTVLGAESGSTAELAKTGLFIALATPIGLFLILAVAYTVYDYRNHKQPLLAEDPGVSYSYFHHLKVVAIPLAKYRIKVSVDQALPGRSDKISKF